LLAGNLKLRRKAIEDYLRLTLDRLYAEGKETHATELVFSSGQEGRNNDNPENDPRSTGSSEPN